MKKNDNHYNLAKELVRQYPNGSVCSQGHLRAKSLQLPRDINDLRYKEPWKLEDFKGSKVNIIASPCIHTGTKQAEDYRLSENAFSKLKKVYKLTSDGAPQPNPRQPWEMDVEIASRQVQVRNRVTGIISWMLPEEMTAHHEKYNSNEQLQCL